MFYQKKCWYILKNVATLNELFTFSFFSLKKFYYSSSNLQYFKNLIKVPHLPEVSNLQNYSWRNLELRMTTQRYRRNTREFNSVQLQNNMAHNS